MTYIYVHGVALTTDWPRTWSPAWCSYRRLLRVVPGDVENPLGDDEADTVEEVGGWQEGKHAEQRRHAQHSLLVDILKRVSS